MNTTETNRLIAEFIELDRYGKSEWIFENVPYGNDELLFDLRWDWLMLACEKIESLGYAVEIVESFCRIKKHDVVLCDIGGGDYTKLSATYEAVTRFVTVYGETSKP